eukprot:scaffold42418_cov69-Phaeocystis_antarctica.AAC.2
MGTMPSAGSSSVRTSSVVCPLHTPRPWCSRCPPRSSSPARTRPSTTRLTARSRCRSAPRGSRSAATRPRCSSRRGRTASEAKRRQHTPCQRGSPGTGRTSSRGTCLRRTTPGSARPSPLGTAQLVPLCCGVGALAAAGCRRGAREAVGAGGAHDALGLCH